MVRRINQETFARTVLGMSDDMFSNIRENPAGMDSESLVCWARVQYYLNLVGWLWED